MTTKTTAIASETLDTFHRNNPGFDLQRFNFFDAPALDKLSWQGLDGTVVTEQLKGLQRLGHLLPEHEQAVALYNTGVHSCFQITAMAEERFVQEYGSTLGGAGAAKGLYERALTRKTQLMLRYASLHSHGDTHYRALRANNLSAATDTAYQSLPSYEQLFGGLDFCSCEDCRSIFSPAAYLVDLIRFKEVEIDDRAVNPLYKLETRRPDLAAIELSCENTNTLIPKLNIANALLEQIISQPVAVESEPLINLALEDAQIVDSSEDPIEFEVVGEPNWVLGRRNTTDSAIHFDSSLSIETDNNVDLGSEYSLAAWIYFSDGENGTIASASDGIGQMMFFLSHDSNPPDTWILCGNFYLQGQGDYTFSIEDRFIQKDIWTHVAMVVRSGSIALFIDGHGTHFDCPSISQNYKLQFGPNSTGTIDEITVYDTALSDAQIQTLAQDGNAQEDVYHHLTQEIYPFNAPFHLALERIRTQLAQLRTALPIIWKTFNYLDITPFAPVAYLPFEGDTKDHGLAHYDWSVQGTLHFVEGRQKGLQALQFDGETLLESARPCNLGSAYTWAAWVYANQSNSGKIISTRDETHYIGVEYLDNEVTGTFLALKHRYTDRSTLYIPIPENQWTHVAIAVRLAEPGKKSDLYEVREFVNGVPHQDWSVKPIAVDNFLDIGKEFNGILGEVSLYNSALSEEEVANLAAYTPSHRTYQAQIDRELLKLSPQEKEFYTTTATTNESLEQAYGLYTAWTDHEDGIVNIDVFLAQTGLTRMELDDLLFGDLSEEELGQALNADFFITAGYSVITIDETTNQFVGLGPNSADHLHRFIRLSRKTDLSFMELDWVLRCTNKGMRDEGIVDAALPLLASLSTWRKVYSRPVFELCTLFGPIRDFGKKSGQSFFDSIFHQVETDSSLNLPDVGIIWDVDANDSNSNALCTSLAGSLGVSQEDMVLLGKAVLKGFNLQQLPLDLNELSALYRLSLVAQLLKISIADVLRLSTIIGDACLNTLAGLPSLGAIDNFNQLAGLKKWLSTAGMNLDQLEYILRGRALPSSSLYLSFESILNFINGLYSSVQTALITETVIQSNADLQVEGLNGRIIDWLAVLQEWETIDAYGIVLKMLPAHQIAGLLDGLVVAENIPNLSATLASLLTYYRQLQDQTLHDALTSQFGVPSDTTPELQRWTLLTIHRESALLQTLVTPALEKGDILDSSDGISRRINRLLNQFGRYACLSTTLKLSRAEITSIIDNPSFYEISNPLNLNLGDVYHLGDFKRLVNTYQDQDNGFIAYFVAVSGAITQQDLSIVAPGQEAALWANLVAEDYIDPQGHIQQAFKDLSDVNDFELNDDVFGSIKQKVYALLSTRIAPYHLDAISQQLSELTQWNKEQIDVALKYFWPETSEGSNQSTPYPYGTSVAVMRLKRTFDLSQQTGLNLSTLLGLDSLKDTTNYDDFDAAADNLLSTVKAKYSDTDWETVYKPIEQVLNEKKRDVLADSVIHFLQNNGLPEIKLRYLLK